MAFVPASFNSAGVLEAAGAGEGASETAESGDGWIIRVNGSTVGSVAPVSLDAPVWASTAYGIELDITSAFDVARTTTRYQALPTTPAAEFDLALLVPESTAASVVEQKIRTSAGDLLETLTVFDEFRGKGVPEGYRSVAWRLTLRHPERTLREKEIEGRRDKILRTLDQELGVRQRAS